MKTMKIVAICLLFLTACSQQLLLQKNWQLTYRKVDSFMGSTIIQLGIDSCYYETTGGLHKHPFIIKWKSRQRELNRLYQQVQELWLQEGYPLMASATETPFETLELVQENKILFAVQKDQQPVTILGKFEEAVRIMRSFAVAEKGWKY